MSALGTQELLGTLLAEAVLPLRHAIESPRALRGFCAELGVLPPAEVTDDANVASAMADLADHLDALPGLLADLADARASDDNLAVASAGTELLLRGVTTVDTGVELVEHATATLADPTLAASFVDELPDRLAGLLTFRWLSRQHPLLLGAALVGGVLDIEVERADDPTESRPTTRRYRARADRLVGLLTDPLDTLGEASGWGTPDVDDERLLRAAAIALESLGVLAYVEQDGGTPRLRTIRTSTALETSTDPPGFATGLAIDPVVAVDRTVPLPAGWHLDLTADLDLGDGPSLQILPPLAVAIEADTAGSAGSLTASLRRPLEATDPLIVLGSSGGPRLEADTIRADATLDLALTDDGLQAEPRVTVVLEEGRLLLTLGGADGFLAAVLPGDLTVDAAVTLRWTPDGLTIEGGVALELVVPLSLRLGPVRLDRLSLQLAPGTGAVTIAARLRGGIELGPIRASVSGIGGSVTVTAPDDDDVGVGLTPAFLPPTGLGLAIDAGLVQGGGFIELLPDEGRYLGSLQLTIGPVGITALGLLDTQLPDGTDGYSLLVVLRSAFPPITLPFGFTLNSVGGLVGLHRRIDVDTLRDRFSSGAVGDILAPEDPVGNAPALLELLGEVFPVSPGTLVVGPTLQLGWATIVTFDLGVFLELPGPSTILLLGSVRAAIDHPAGGTPFMQIRLDVLGVIDPGAGTVEFDAVLVDSHLLEVFELTGGAALRLSGSGQPHVVLSLGGFHPRYDPAPLTFPDSLTRIAMTRGSPSDALFLRFEGYLAATPGSLQLGASVEMVLRASRFVAEGSFAFDTLVRLQPFGVELDVRASMRVRYGSRTLAGVDVVGALTGPGPVTFTGEVSIEVLFVTLSWSGSFRFGSETPPPLPTVSDVAALVVDELADPRNLAGTGEDPWVVVSPERGDDDLAVLLPSGGVVWAQTRVPFGLTLARFEGARVTEPVRLQVTAELPSGGAAAHDDWFAPAAFLDLTDAEQVDRPAFERMDAGLRLAAPDPVVPTGHSMVLTFEELWLPKTSSQDGVVDGRALHPWMLDAADGRIPCPVRPGPAVRPGRARFEVRRQDDGQLLTPDAGGWSAHEAHQQADRTAMSAVLLEDDLLSTPAL